MSEPLNGMASPTDIQVIIIGGGGVGLNLSTFLSHEKVEHVLFEKHEGTSILPKAHYLNQRTMEICRKYGTYDQIVETACPLHNMSRVQWMTSLGGDGPFDGRLLGHLDAAGGAEGTESANMYRRDSAATSTNLPLLRLEPILRKIAEERNPGKVLFNHTVVDFEEKEDKVLVTVKNAEGQIIQYRAQYVVAADAGKLSTPKLGINMEGITGLVDFVSTHFKADLSSYWDDRTLITHFINPEGEKMVHLDCGALLQMGPSWGRKSEEWLLTFGFPVEDINRLDKEALIPRIRRLMKLPDLEMEVLQISHWVLDRVVADKYRVGRVFVAGDAAHRRPPTTGLGLNTGIEDAQNIAWKLGQVLAGKADSSLLDTYESERRPIGIRNTNWAFFTFNNMQVLNAGVGLIPGQKEHNHQRFLRLFEDSEDGHAQLEHVRRILQTQNIEYSAHDIELGFVYENGACVPDGTKAPIPDPRGQVYNPTTRPGHRLPHAWIEKDGRKFSTHDLITLNSSDFCIITDEDGEGWVEAAKKITQTTGLKIGSAQIKSKPHIKSDNLYIDSRDSWARLKEVVGGGAILVRPDNFIAWRSNSSPSDAERELSDVLAKLLKPAQ